MEEKKKRSVYITIIILCILGTVGILFFFNSSPEPEPLGDLSGPVNVPVTNTASTSAAGIDLSTADFPVPQVFPANDKFSTSVLNSSMVQSLNDYQPVTVNETELNREDPFARF